VEEEEEEEGEQENERGGGGGGGGGGNNEVYVEEEKAELENRKTRISIVTRRKDKGETDKNITSIKKKR
jgi:hypothetical protein